MDIIIVITMYNFYLFIYLYIYIYIYILECKCVVTYIQINQINKQFNTLIYVHFYEYYL